MRFWLVEKVEQYAEGKKRYKLVLRAPGLGRLAYLVSKEMFQEAMLMRTYDVAVTLLEPETDPSFPFSVKDDDFLDS